MLSRPSCLQRPHNHGLATRLAMCMGIGICLLFASSLALAQTPIKFLNDWRWEGQSAPLLLANKGYFQKENLAVSLTPGTGSGATVAKVASGEFDMGLGDFSA